MEQVFAMSDLIQVIGSHVENLYDLMITNRLVYDSCSSVMESRMKRLYHDDRIYENESHTYKINIMRYMGIEKYCETAVSKKLINICITSRHHALSTHRADICHLCISNVLNHDKIEILEKVLSRFSRCDLLIIKRISIHRFIQQPQCSVYLVTNCHAMFEFNSLDIRIFEDEISLFVSSNGYDVLLRIDKEKLYSIKLLYGTCVLIRPRLRLYLDNLPS